MSWRVHVQTNGLRAVWSTVVDDYIAIDCGEDDIEDMCMVEAIRAGRQTCKRLLAKEEVLKEPVMGQKK